MDATIFYITKNINGNKGDFKNEQDRFSKSN